MAPIVASTEGDEYVAELIPVDNRLYDGMTIKGLLDKFSPPGPPSYVYVVDRIALNNPEHPILVIDTGSAEYGTRGLVVRVIPKEVASIEANLSIGNTGLIDYKDAADRDGVFRGFQQ
ncbi:hypothetical protein [Williamsia sp. 1135]|uniref:DUF6924 domain-containing protein n=1 Tax=Williamsia sp. 1135 TaxID=1889262 RepID=UPI000A107A9F|nr:hypothetical protein [Williamsia sp. 1135]ORM32782.1 hypothetical protein BFL43_14790 [Williamsia sp. 1135]